MDRRVIKVFMASPSDLVHERRLFRERLEQLSDGFGEGAGVRFESSGWEDIHPVGVSRAQDPINAKIDACEVFVLVMGRRWGDPPPDSDYRSYTEEEYERALRRFKDTGRPLILVFFKQVDPESIQPRDLDDIRPGGLGVHIIREVMDEVAYEKRQGPGMRLTMIKHQPADSESVAEAAEAPDREQVQP